MMTMMKTMMNPELSTLRMDNNDETLRVHVPIWYILGP